MTIKKINKNTFVFDGAKIVVGKDTMKVNGSDPMVPGAVFALLTKSVARKLRKLLADMGHNKLAAAKRAA
jgi:hypothetical protein